MRCGLLGEHLSHSFSPQIHARLGNYAYTLFEVPPEGLENFLRNGPWDAINVTIPYKRAVMPFCTALSPAAQSMGSVNTLLRQPDGSLWGDNTDLDGFSWLLDRNGGIAPGEKALVLGTGGASQTVQAVLRARGAHVVAISRQGPETYEDLYRHRDTIVLVNATPVGMFPDNGRCLVNLEELPRLQCVLDLIYNPARTALLLAAEARNIRWENGLSMLVGQAKRAAELFTGTSLPASRCREILEELRRDSENIVLIGMPGCGKSTVGRLLAQMLGRPFVDADAEVEARVGNISAFFTAHGEAAFRREETAVLAELGKRTGCVIATGGGCVIRRENFPLLRQNGRLVWLRRPLERLPVAGRPVSQATDLATLYARRAPLYARWSDLAIDAQAGARATAEALCKRLGQTPVGGCL